MLQNVIDKNFYWIGLNFEMANHKYLQFEGEQSDGTALRCCRSQTLLDGKKSQWHILNKSGAFLCLKCIQ
jgi:hypothetical protein